MSNITITPIGTCRINTPLRRGATRYPIKVNLDRVYGFVHTSEEAVQQLGFMMGERDFPAPLKPVIFRPAFDAGRIAQTWTPADLHIVEISSAKRYRVDGVSVQSNYFMRHFADFFASAPRSRRYWSLVAATHRTAREERLAFLRQEPVFRQYGPEERSILCELSVTQQSFEDVLGDMTTLVEKLGAARVLFVSHVNAVTADGAVIPSRDKLIRWVRLAAQRLDVPCFDPTEMMRAFGQEKAMEREGLDTTHYTDPFSDRWYTQVHREYVMPRILAAGFDDAPGDPADPSRLVESIAAAMENDDFFEGAQQLFAALARHGENPGLLQLAGQVYHRLGDYASVVRVLEPVWRSADLATGGKMALMQAYHEVDRPAEAVEVAERLLADEYESIEIYELAGLAAEKLARYEDAARFDKLAFRLDPSQHRFAIRVLDHYAALGDAEKLATWQAELADRLSATSDVPLARAMAEWALSARDDALFLKSLMIVVHAELPSAERLVEEAVSQGMLTVAAEAILAITAMPNVTGRIMRTFRTIAETWAGTAQDLYAEGRTTEAFALASASQSILPRNGVARRIEKSVVLDLRNAMRAALVDGDHDKVIALGEQAGHLLYRRQEIAVAYAKALLAAGRGDEALDVARQAHEAFPDNIDVHALSAQVAAAQGDFMLGLRLYGTLRGSADPAVERYRPKVERFLTSAARTGLKMVRELAAANEFEQAIELCRLMDTYTDARERAALELHKVHRALRTRLRELDDEEEAGDETLRVLRLMLSITPEDGAVLRRAALESMKRRDFATALEFWQALDRVAPGNESTLRNINQCSIYARRQAAASGNAREAMVA